MTRRVQVLAVVVVALALARGGAALLREAPALAPPLAAFEPRQVTRVVLSRGDRSLTLERAGGGSGWVVVGPDGARAAARPGVDDLLERARAWRRDRPVGDDPAQHERWGVEGPTARGLRLLGAGGPLADLRVGRMAGVEVADAIGKGGALDTGRLGLLVRVAGEGATWVVTDFFTRELEPDPAVWLAPPLSARLDDVRRLAVTLPDGRAALTFEPGRGFALEGDPRPADPARAFALLRAVVGLRPSGVGLATDRAPADAGTLELLVMGRDGLVPRSARLWQAPPAGPGPPRVLVDAGGGPVELDPGALVQVRDLVLGGLVRRRAFLGGPEGVVGLEWSRTGGARLALARLPEGWQAQVGERRVVCPDADVSAVLEGLFSLEALAWDTGGAGALRGGDADVVTLIDERGARHSLTIGDATREDGARAAAISSAALPFWLDARPLGDILGRLERLAR